MAKLYTPKKVVAKEMKPPKKTIDFLLNYSKALEVVTAKGIQIKVIRN